MGESKQLERVRNEIQKYISVVDKLHLGNRPDATVKAGAQKIPRRNGKAPIGDAGHRFLSDPGNADAARKIDPAIYELRHSRAAYCGISLYYTICTAGLGGAWGVDFGELRRWEAGETEDARHYYAAYQKALDLLARSVVAACKAKGISPEMRVNVKGDDGKSDEPSDSPQNAAYRDRKITTADTDATIVEELERIESETGLPRERAKLQLVAEREQTDKPIGVDRVRRAIQRNNVTKRSANAS